MHHQWLQREIASGLMKLLSLRLPGHPAEDTVEMTLATWIDSLTVNRVWDQGQDAPRIRHAFRVLGATRTDWPAPANLVEHLPPVEKRLALPEKIVSPEVAEANIERIKRMLAGQEDVDV